MSTRIVLFSLSLLASAYDVQAGEGGGVEPKDCKEHWNACWQVGVSFVHPSFMKFEYTQPDYSPHITATDTVQPGTGGNGKTTVMPGVYARFSLANWFDDNPFELLVGLEYLKLEASPRVHILSERFVEGTGDYEVDIFGSLDISASYWRLPVILSRRFHETGQLSFSGFGGMSLNFKASSKVSAFPIDLYYSIDPDRVFEGEIDLASKGDIGAASFSPALQAGAGMRWRPTWLAGNALTAELYYERWMKDVFPGIKADAADFERMLSSRKPEMLGLRVGYEF